MLVLLLVGLIAAPPSLPENEVGERQARPIRVERPLLVGAEVGINGLTGFGPALSYTFNGVWSLDVAAGASAQLARGGVRARYTFLPKQASPFVGIGALYALGTPYELKGFRGDKSVVYQIAGAPLAQAVLGAVYNHRNGFTIMGSLGWAQLLTRGSNVIVKQGAFSDSNLRGIRWAAGSGPVASIGVGYSF